MKLLSFILALLLVCSLFGCSAKADTNEKENDTTVSDVEKETENNKEEKPAPSDKDDDTVAVGETEDADGKKEPADSEATDNKTESDKETSAPSKDTAAVPDKETNALADTESKDDKVEDDTSYTDGTVIEVYIYTLAAYISSDYKRGESNPDANLLHVAALFLYEQRHDEIEISEDTGKFSISGATLEKTMKLLFGNEISISDYISHLDADMGDEYDKESDTYSFDLFRKSWGEGGYGASMDHEMDFKDKTKSFSISLTLVNSKGKTKEATYKFSKVVSDGYLYFRLEEVDVK